MNDKISAEAIPRQEFYKVSDIMKILCISRSTAYKYIKEKDFPKIVLCDSPKKKIYRIPRQEFEEWCRRKGVGYD